MKEVYREEVKDLFFKNSDGIIACSSNDLYSVAIEEIFNNALYEIIWFIEEEISLEKVFTRQMADSIIKYLDSGRKFNLYINKRYPDGLFGQFRASLLNKYENFKYTKVSAVYADNKTVEFIVFDNKGYRYKPDTNKAAAIFCVNDVGFANKLAKVFK